MKKKERLSFNNRFATTVGIFGIIIYAFVRYYDGLRVIEYRQDSHLVMLICLITAIAVIGIQLIFKNKSITPVLIGVLINLSFVFGAYVTRDFEYYYITTLCIAGIVGLYQDFRAIFVYFIINFVINSILTLTVFRNPAICDFRPLLICGVLYLYGFFFLLVLNYRSTKRQNSADKGLQAFSALLHTTPNYMVITDELKRVQYISDTLARFAGIKKTEHTVGRPLLDLFKDSNLKVMFTDVLDADGLFEDTREIDFNNEMHYFKIISDKLRDGSGGSFIDITDVTQTVAAMLDAEDAKIAAERANESKSKFLATMSHEIRTPMNAIIGIADIELQNADLDRHLREALTKVNTSGHVLLGIINDILDLSKIETGKLELQPSVYDMPSLINDTVQLNIIRIGGKPIDFNLNIDERLPLALFGDELRIKQIINNVLSNAFKYTTRGQVTMSVSHEVLGESPGDPVNIVFSISDTGQGMKSDDVDKLFTEYSRFNHDQNHATEGTGLGLSITRQLVAMMNGSIKVDSEYGVGSTFSVTITQGYVDKRTIGAELTNQIKDFSYTDKRLQLSNFKRTELPGGKVLIVDDIEMNLYVAKGLMKPYGMDVSTALSGVEALNIIEAGNTFDIIFMDHMMPEMDGVETTKHLRESGYSGTIVALTANAISGQAEAMIELGFNDFISKPIDVVALNKILTKYIHQPGKPLNPQEPGVAASEPASASQEPDVAASEPASASQELDVAAFEPNENASDGERDGRINADALAAQDPILLKLFTNDAAKSLVMLAESRENNDLKLLQVNVHGMKSASLSIGQKDVSAFALEMEMAAREQNNTFIDEHYNEFVSVLEQLTAVCKELSAGVKL
jgi:signal transduction histidine kinase/DNA-binding response OmpR family regulator/HPt (histidine-containing phosphotransfer) domain-containing protein